MRHSRFARVRSTIISLTLAIIAAGISAATVLADGGGGPIPR